MLFPELEMREADRWKFASRSGTKLRVLGIEVRDHGSKMWKCDASGTRVRARALLLIGQLLEEIV